MAEVIGMCWGYRHTPPELILFAWFLFEMKSDSIMEIID